MSAWPSGLRLAATAAGRAAILLPAISCMLGGQLQQQGGQQRLVLLAEAVTFDGSDYARNVSLGDDADLDLFWTIDTDANTIRVAVHAKAASGWAGVGVSEMGGMEGADILLYEAATGDVTDAHALVAGAPIVDECTQDWVLLSSDAGDGGLVFEAERALDTGDAQDRTFSDDTGDGARPSHLIAAWGDSESVSFHGTSVSKTAIFFFGTQDDANTELFADSASSTAAGGVSFFDITTKNFTIPTDRTWYQDTCITASELPDFDEYHAIGFQTLVQEDTSEFVHHLVVSGWTGTTDCGKSCDDWVNDNIPTESASSYTSSFSVLAYLEENNITIPAFCYYDYVDIILWGPGVRDSELPADVGFLFGGNTSSGRDGFTSVSINTHYNNPDGVAGMNDSSGVRVYFTDELRPMDMGVIKLGDPDTNLEGVRIPEGKSEVLFECPGSCTEQYFEAEEVTVFSHMMHMHENGRKLQTRQYRNDSGGNEFLVRSVEVEYFSFVQAAAYFAPGNSTIQKGDRFETECFYDTALSSVGAENVTFGLGSENEMCIDYVFYYPDQRVPDSGTCGYGGCNGSAESLTELEPSSDFNRTFGTAGTCTVDAVEDDGESSSASAAAPPGGAALLAWSATAAAFILLAAAGTRV